MGFNITLMHRMGLQISCKERFPKSHILNKHYVDPLFGRNDYCITQNHKSCCNKRMTGVINNRMMASKNVTRHLQKLVVIQ